MTPMFESWEVEDYCPGKPILPHGCFEYQQASGTDRFYYFQCVSGQNSTNPAIGLVPEARGISHPARSRRAES